MGNFFNYITKPIKPEEVDILFRANNVIREKMELYSDFTLTLNILVVNTYLGEIDTPKETKINLTDEDNQKHFEWCWGKVIDIFQEEGVKFNREGEHLDYFKKFYPDAEGLSKLLTNQKYFSSSLIVGKNRTKYTNYLHLFNLCKNENEVGSPAIIRGDFITVRNKNNFLY